MRITTSIVGEKLVVKFNQFYMNIIIKNDNFNVQKVLNEQIGSKTSDKKCHHT